MIIAGCAASTIADHTPAAIGGLPEGAPARPETPAAYPAVNDMPPARSTSILTGEEQTKVEEELVAARNRAAVASSGKGKPASPKSGAPNSAAPKPGSAKLGSDKPGSAKSGSDKSAAAKDAGTRSADSKAATASPTSGRPAASKSAGDMSTGDKPDSTGSPQ